MIQLHPRRQRILLAAVLLGVVIPALAGAPQPTPLKEQKPSAASGVAVFFESAGSSQSDARSDRLLALYVPEHTPPTPFLPPGPFKATLEADLVLRLRDEITFSIAATGTVKLTVNDQPVIDTVIPDEPKMISAQHPLRLNKGKNRIVVQYQSPARGDAMLRVYWSAADFPPEPIPPSMLVHNDADLKLRTSARIRTGRERFADLRCAACHADPQVASFTTAAATSLSSGGAGQSMPGLAQDAPALSTIGARRNQAWLAHWINNPKAHRFDATMPRLFGNGNEDQLDPRALDAAAYLASLGAAEAKPAPDATDNDLLEGGHLFAFLRCAGCHTLPENQEVDIENGRIALRHVKAKFAGYAALVSFLKQPNQHYRWIRMPDFKLTDGEAAQLATFLLSREQPALELPGEIKGDPIRGREIITTSGCLNCHTLTDSNNPLVSTLKSPALPAIPDDHWLRGCLAPDADTRGAAPDFSLDDDQRDALLAFLATDRSSLGRESAAEFAQRQLNTLNCIACHSRDDIEDTFTLVEAEVADLIADVPAPQPGESEFSPDQSEPILTWTGEKLRPEWAGRFVTGKVEEKLRPWLRARMPAFPVRGQLLAEGFAMQHGFPPKSSQAPLPRDASLAEIGRTLTGKEGGLACVTCHDVGPMKATSVFEAPAVAFQFIDERITRHYYDRWVYNPLRVHKETKMPAFADPEGKTAITDLLDGDARRQYDAIHHYLREGRKIRPPEN